MYNNNSPSADHAAQTAAHGGDKINTHTRTVHSLKYKLLYTCACTKADFGRRRHVVATKDYDTRERGRARFLYNVIQVDLVLIAVFRCVN